MAAAIVKVAGNSRQVIQASSGICLKFAYLEGRQDWYEHCFDFIRENERMSPSRPYLTEDDIRFELRFMIRWCRLFRKSAVDWVNLEAKRFRERYPLPSHEPNCKA
jgi:hypothetical protein